VTATKVLATGYDRRHYTSTGRPKRAYPTRSAAKRGANGGHWTDEKPDYYHCPVCDWWHLGRERTA
jgi:hypothetical protein